MLRYLKSLGSSVFKRLFKDKIEAVIFFIAFTVEMALGLYLVYRWGCTYIGTGDQLAHLYIAKAVIDNGVNSGFAQLGTVWPPVFHLLLIPFVSIDVLYTTGLAGTIVNALMTAGISVLISRLAGERKLGVLASLLFMFNPYTLFVFGCSVWMPLAGMFFALLATYYFRLYWEKNDVKEFMKCSLALILGSLTRYEVWPVAVLIVFFFTLKELKNGQKYRIAYAHLPLWGVFAWLFYNLAIFRNPLIWISGPFPGAEGYYGGVIERIIHPSLADAVSYGFPSMIMLLGYIWLFLPLAMVLPLIRKDWKTLVTVLLLTSPLVLFFEVGSTQRLSVAKLYFSLPAVILTCFFITGLIKGGFRVRVFKVPLIICLIFMYGITLPSQYARLSTNPRMFFLPNSSTVIEGYFKVRNETLLIKDTMGQGSYILASGRGSTSPAKLLSVICGFSPSKIIDEYDNPLFGKASKMPWKYCEYVVVDKSAGSESSLEAQNEYYGGHFVYLFHFDSEWRSEFSEYYQLILETNNYLVYQLRRQ